MDGSKQVQGDETDRAGVRKNHDLFALVRPQYISEFAGDAAKKMSIAFAFCDDVLDVAVDEGVIVLRMGNTGFVKCQALENADMALSKGGRGNYGKIEHIGKGLSGLYSSGQIARINRLDALFCKQFCCDPGLFFAKRGKRRGTMPPETPFGISGGLTVSNQI